MASACLYTDCLSYYTLYSTCLGGDFNTVNPTPQQTACICSATAIQYYTQCYPCLSTQPSPSGPVPTVSQYTTVCAAAAKNPTGTSSGVFTGFTGFPTGTGSYPPSPPPTLPPTPPPSKDNTGLYIGIGVAVGVLVLGAALFFWYRSRKPKTPPGKETPPLPPPPMQQVQQNQHQHQHQPLPPLPPVPAPLPQTPPQQQYQQSPTQQQYDYQQQQLQQQQFQPQQQQQPYDYQQQQYQQSPPQQQQYDYQQQQYSQPPPATGYYAQAQGGYQDPNQGYSAYPTASTVVPKPLPTPSPTFTPNDTYYQQQQHQQAAAHNFSPVMTTSGVHQEPMPMPGQSNPNAYSLTSPVATTATVGVASPSMTATNSTGYEAETPASTTTKPLLSTHGPQVIPAHSQVAAGIPQNPQYVEPYHNSGNYHN
ncbi:hypothetical protein BGX33_007255 [Mortierella sp. NVP41]|nr:hypothetical protein BGX33_007255 [Mortierella sp. NVP41]